MTRTELPPRTLSDLTAPDPYRVRRKWSWAHYLALVGIPFLLWETWTIVAWLADGPVQVTEFRDRNSLNWYAARFYEGLAIFIAGLVVLHLVRRYRRTGQVWNFDLMLCLVGATIFWADYGVNFFMPVFLESSNFVNLTNTCGHMPFVVNPDCGRAPDAMIFWPLVFTFGVLGFFVVAEAGIRRLRQRWPSMSTAQLVLVALGVGLVIDLLLEPPAIALGLWTYNGGPVTLKLGSYRFPLIEAVAATFWFGPLLLLRMMKNDKGQTLVERGLEHHSPRLQKGIALLALYGIVQVVSWGPGTLMVIGGPYAHPWPKLPKYMVNDICNTPGITGTRYGTCPGDPGYRMPGRHSLPGKSP